MTSEERKSFGVLLTLALALPVIVGIGAWCVQWLARFPPRSAGAALTAVVFLIGSLAEIIPVPIAITRLARDSSLRSRRNVVLTIIATLFLLPGLAIYIALMLEG